MRLSTGMAMVAQAVSALLAGAPLAAVLFQSLSIGLGATPAGGAMDARGGNAGGGRGAVEFFLVRTAVVLDHAGNPRRRLGADRPGRVVH